MKIRISTSPLHLIVRSMKVEVKNGDFRGFFFHLPPLRFHCADRCWDIEPRAVATGALAVSALTTSLDLIRN